MLGGSIGNIGGAGNAISDGSVVGRQRFGRALVRRSLFVHDFVILGRLNRVQLGPKGADVIDVYQDGDLSRSVDKVGGG